VYGDHRRENNRHQRQPDARCVEVQADRQGCRGAGHRHEAMNESHGAGEAACPRRQEQREPQHQPKDRAKHAGDELEHTPPDGFLAAATTREVAAARQR
jgi:hypothetical protein